jgi:hypothetical protein
LLDHSASEIGIDETALGTSHSVTQGVIGDAFVPHEPRKASRFENPHHPPISCGHDDVLPLGYQFKTPVFSNAHNAVSIGRPPIALAVIPG